MPNPAFKRVAVVDPNTGIVVHVILIEPEKTIDADHRAARGPAIIRHETTTLNLETQSIETEVREEAYEAVYEPWMHNEAHRGFLLVEDAGLVAHVGDTWTDAHGFVEHVLSEEEVKQLHAEKQRNGVYLLTNSAWSQAPDEPSEVREKWATYRGKVREIMASTDDPRDTEWPRIPE